MPEQKCPVCEKEMKVVADYLDGRTLLEECHSCPDKCYFYTYAYGSTEVYVGEREWGWHYTTPYPKVRQYEEQINEAVAEMRAALAPADV